ncbi:MAG: hypothetical protein QM296_11175 [Bacillota bacterium]|nr:hypothetical protein [Bacillota bacterium]
MKQKDSRKTESSAPSRGRSPRSILIAFVAVLIVAGGAFLAYRALNPTDPGGQTEKTSQTGQTSSEGTSSQSESPPEPEDPGELDLDQRGFEYLPDREYILAPGEEERPETLDELLYSQEPDIEDFLRSPGIAEELLAAENLTDIVDSRYSLNNLREISRQLEERTAEEDLGMGDLVTVRSTPIEAPVREKPPGPEDELRQFMPPPAPVEQRDPLPKSEGARRLDEAADSIDLSRPAEAVAVVESYSDQQDVFVDLRDKCSDLLDDVEYGEWERMPSSINMKGIWQNPGEALIHMIPEADWLPEEGYSIYRLIGGQKELIAQQQAAAASVMSSDFDHPDASEIQNVYESADYNAASEAATGMDEESFNDTVYQTRPPLRPLEHMGGERDFLLMRQMQITVPDGIEQKVPESDRALNSPVQMMNLPENGRYEAGAIRSRVWERFSVEQSSLPSGIQTIAETGGTENASYKKAASTLGARQQISTLAFVDDEFAEEAGFLIRDNIADKKLPNGEPITYIIEAPGGQSARVELHWGEELKLTKPEGFLGYGLDGKVFLRWRKPANEAEGRIISGYFIERKLEGESTFTTVNEKPVVIAEVLDTTGLFCETPVMYQEKLENGTKAEYRLYSIDIFGRRSECCAPIKLRVEKVTPPDAPTAASLVLSTDETPPSDDPLGQAVQEALAKNSGREGIVIPIFNESPDTVRFTLYRAEKVGVGSYGKPVPLANFRFDNPKKGEEGGKEGTLPGTVPPELLDEVAGGAGASQEETASTAPVEEEPAHYLSGVLHHALQFVLASNTPKAPDMVYFDANVEKGVTYKYWISAWDSWNNESAWSKSAAIGVPSDVEPSVPAALTISMMTRKLPDYSILPPGLVMDENVSNTDVEENWSGSARASAENTSLVEMADNSGATVGAYLGVDGSPVILTRFFDNLPEQKYIHVFLGVQGKDVLPDGSTRLRWPAYSGDDLGGYVVYQLVGKSPPLEKLETTDRDQLLAMGQWTKLTEKPLEQNLYLIQGLEPGGEGVDIFLICLEPAAAEGTAAEEGSAEEGSPEDGKSEEDGGFKPIPVRTSNDNPINNNPEGGYVLLEWEEPEDLQVKYYRIYRSEVKNFKKPIDESTLEWTMVKDLAFGTQYADPVEQSHAHYYYYKITAVSPWGVESSVGTVQKFRVPSTKPPQTPNLLLPLSRKDGVAVNFSSVEYCCRYEVYRAEIPKITAETLGNIDPAILETVFATPTVTDEFLTQFLAEGTARAQAGSGQEINPLLGFKTVNLSETDALTEELSDVDVALRQRVFSELIHTLGPLAVSEYRDLSEQMMALVGWEKVGELPVDEDTQEEVDPQTGLKKPLQIIDYNAKYGTHYLYTVQAWNDDELGSTKPEPIEATPRRNRPFDPIDGLAYTITYGDNPSINLTWNKPHMEGLTEKQCLEDTVGYIVYYCTEKDGVYVQASPLEFSTLWRDYKTDRAATNWYKVRVLDTGGYLSDFSEPILAREDVTIELPRTQIPDGVRMERPKLSMDPLYHTNPQDLGMAIPFGVTGDEPMEFILEAVDDDGNLVSEITLLEQARLVDVNPHLAIGHYTVTLVASNMAGADELVFEVEITERLDPPALYMDESSFIFDEGYEQWIQFTVTGSEPITLELSAWHTDSQSEADIYLSEWEDEIVVPYYLSPGDYIVSLTATNQVGQAELVFDVIIVEEWGEPPDITIEDTQPTFLTGYVEDIPFTISGSEPITYDLYVEDYAGESVTHLFSVDEWERKIIVDRDIVYGTYKGTISASNNWGWDEEHFTLYIYRPPLKAPDDSTSLVSFTVEPEPVVSRAMALSDRPVRLSGGTSEPLPDDTYTSDSGIFSYYTLKNIVLVNPAPHLVHTKVPYMGTADLIFGDPDTGQVLPVQIAGAEFAEEGDITVFTAGVLYVDKPYKLEEIGVTISSLYIPFTDMGKASGYVQNADPSKNLIGNLTGFIFVDAPFRDPYKLYIGLPAGKESVLPPVRIDRLTLDKVSSIELHLDRNGESEDVLSLITEATLKAPLETLNNEALKMSSLGLSCDAHGRITGRLDMVDSPDGQFLQLLVPGGAGLRVKASIVYKKGVPTDEGFIQGRIILPFEQSDYMGPGVPASYAQTHSTVNTMDYIMNPNYDKDKHDDKTTTKYYIKFGETVQKNGLLIVPADPEMQKNCAFAEFNVTNWKGEGFLVDSAQLTPVRVTERSLSSKDQRDQAIVVTASEISIDLDRNDFFAKSEGSQTPRETEKPFWVGMVFKGGSLSLPPAFIETTDGKPIQFKLAPGEMIYDLNGFNYQTFMYNDDGVDARFGERLGGFTQVKVFDCLLDMYANKVNLEINAKVALELFNNNWVNVKLYTNKEDNADGAAGQLLCSVAETVIEDFVGLGTTLTIDGGFLKPEGMRFAGSVDLKTPEIQLKEPMKFTSMVVPAKKTATFSANNTKKQHGWATLDKTCPVHMQGFSLDIREINFEYLAANVTPGTATRLSLWGSVLLSEEIALGSDTTDCIAVDTLKGTELELPVVIYDQSYSMLETSFDECIDVKGKLVPKRLAEAQTQNWPPQPLMLAAGIYPPRLEAVEQAQGIADQLGKIEQGLIEFETENLELGFLGSLGELPIDTITRFGYDVDNARGYFAIGLLQKGKDNKLNVGIGSLSEFSGLVVNNMVVERNSERQLKFPKEKAAMKQLISGMEVDRGPDGKFAAGIRGTMEIASICEVRDLYFGFENGPLVEASGKLYLPLDVKAMIDGKSFRHVGDVEILYSHPERYFSFNMTLNEIDVIAIKLSGSLGFEFSPKLFGVYIGYPETLAGNVSIYRVGLGLGFRISDDGANIIKGKIEFGFERSVDVSIVYLRGFLYAGADGGYYANIDLNDDKIPDGNKFILTLYLKGGLEGGIKVGGKRFNIISFYLDARGTIESIPPKNDWKLTCSAEVSYSLNLFLFSVSGSVSASFDTTF